MYAWWRGCGRSRWLSFRMARYFSKEVTDDKRS